MTAINDDEKYKFWPHPKGTLLFEHVTPPEITTHEEAEKHPLAWKLIDQRDNVLIAEKVSDPTCVKKCVLEGWNKFRD
jgi:hypothetical protein